MKILLIRPPFAIEKSYFPKFIHESLAIEYLDAFLSPKHDVQTLDTLAEGWNNYWETKEYPGIIFQGINLEKIKKKIIESKPDVIGINWFFSTQNTSINLTIKIIKDVDPNIKIVVGGPHPSGNFKSILESNNDIDVVVYGEGEITTQELLDKKFENLESINGIAFRKNNKIVVNESRELIENLDQIPIPKRDPRLIKNYSKQKIFRALYAKTKNITLASRISPLPIIDKIFYNLYNKKHKDQLPTADIITSRGCPNHCTFCAIHSIWGHRCRMRSAKNVLEEIDLLVRKFGAKHINFQDDNFNVLRDRTIEICKEIVENKYNISILAPAGAFVPTLDEEVLTWLKRAGLCSLRMSIESGNQNVLTNIIKKNINLDHAKEIAEICRKLGIYTEGAFIFGIPGETVETMQDSLNFAKEAGFNRIVKFIFQPFPNTELYDLCLEKGYLTEDYDPNRVYVTGNRCYVKTETLSPEDVLKMVNR